MTLRGYLFAAATAITATVGLSIPAQAASLFSNGGPISFSRNTRVQFDFVVSHGSFKSVFGVYDANKTLVKELLVEDLNRDPIASNKPHQYNNVDSKGTCGVTVAQPCRATFDFIANTSYYLGLSTVGQSTVYSDDPVGGTTPGGFTFVAGPTVASYPTKYQPPYGTNFVPLEVKDGETAIFINDPAPVDLDANDFIVTAKSVPEPATLAGLGAVVAGLAASRRRKAEQTA
jgi:hypothetical protein